MMTVLELKAKSLTRCLTTLFPLLLLFSFADIFGSNHFFLENRFRADISEKSSESAKTDNFLLFFVPNITAGKKMWTWLSNFRIQKTTEEEIDPIGREEIKTYEVRLDENFQKLPTHTLHYFYDAVFTQYSGFHVPMNYEKKELLDEVTKTRWKFSIYDASYKRQFRLIGKDSSKFLNALVTSEIESLEERKSVETLMTNNNGGIIDILLVSKEDKEKLHIVANTPKVLIEVQNHLKKFEGDISFQIPKEECYLTFQGPESENFLKTEFTEIQNLQYMCNEEAEDNYPGCDDNYLITRYSNTSEDGYTISCLCGELLVDRLHFNCDEEEIALIGHEAYECLRIEAGNLSESDFDENTTPVEAELTNLISERKKKEGGFPGSERILKDKPSKRRRGFISEEGRLRKGDTVRSPTGQVIGYVTSGAYSPTAKKFIAMGYIDATYSNKSDDLVFNDGIKGHFHELPFVPHRNSTNRLPGYPRHV